MSTQTNAELLRATILHTRANAFRDNQALVWHADGGVLVEGGRIRSSGSFAAVQAQYPTATVRDLRGGYLLPGFVDTHVHFPQIRVIGGLGRQLLDWLEFHALPEEARMASAEHASRIARAFVHSLVAHGTTTALAFGSHFSQATAELFEAARRNGVRMITGLIVSDRNLRPELHQTPEQCYRQSKELIAAYHGSGRLLYAVTPRFAYSTSEAMLEMCQTLMSEHAGLRFQTHVNENLREMEGVARLFPWAKGYVNVYERFGLAGPGAVLAHNVHPSDAELTRMAAAGTSVSHCPCSNAALGSGIFPMARHLHAGVHFALGTDVGGGTGFGLMKEALQAYLLQRLAPDGLLLSPAQLLYLATLAGAEAVGLGAETGSFDPGKAADIVYWKPPPESPLAYSLETAIDGERILAALLTQAGSESVRQVWVQGAVVYNAAE